MLAAAVRVAVAAGCFLTGCVTGLGKQDPIRQCYALYQRGIFTEESLRCFPDLEERLREPLCRVAASTHMDVITLGFGIGARCTVKPCKIR